MKNIFIAIKVLLNVVLWFVYSLIWVVLSNFVFAWLVPILLNKTVAPAYDPVHLKIAVVTVTVITILTIIFRKYLYLSLKFKIKSKKKDDSKRHNKKLKMKKDEKEDDEIKIYIDKEIK